jgi:hypothetical protein
MADAERFGEAGREHAADFGNCNGNASDAPDGRSGGLDKIGLAIIG